MEQTVFVTKVRTAAGKHAARLLIESLRSFGGAIGGCPIWLFAADAKAAPCQDLAGETVQVISLDMPESFARYEFGDKVYACARAEEMASADVQSLVWIDPACLVLNPPVLYNLGALFDVAVRPVHIRNIGLLAAGPVDIFWRKVYQAAGVADIQTTVESFVDRQRLRAYFNSHSFSVNPAKGLLTRWVRHFEELVCDPGFQASACQDELHRTFLHQAVFSALVATSIDPDRVRVLPPDYNYPYHLHLSVPADRRVVALNDLTSCGYEARELNPDAIQDIEIREPLRSWLNRRRTSG